MSLNNVAASTKLLGGGATLVAVTLLAGCVTAPQKTEDGQYVPPPAEHSLKVQLRGAECSQPDDRIFGEVIGALVSTVAPALVNFGYDQFVNYLESKVANLSVSSSGVATTTLYQSNDGSGGINLKRCLVLTRANTLIARFDLTPTQAKDAVFWHMTPYNLEFKKSEAKEGADKEKSVVADIAFAAPGADGKLTTFFHTTFDLGKRKAADAIVAATDLVGQDSGPVVFPKPLGKDSLVTIKVNASVVEHGEGRDWVRAATKSLQDKENRETILKPILDAISKFAKGG